MLIVISNPTPIANEANLINALFEEGLEVFHLRKPYAKDDKLRMSIEKIGSTHHHKIALHQHHEIAKDYGIKRLHFTEIKRNEINEDALQTLREDYTILSTSIHSIINYNRLSRCFTYTFLGPVFNSISKKDYASTIAAEFVLPAGKNGPQVVALGGINVANVEQAIKMKFDGIAILGIVWDNPRESIQQFKAIQKAWKQADQ